MSQLNAVRQFQVKIGFKSLIKSRLTKMSSEHTTMPERSRNVLRNGQTMTNSSSASAMKVPAISLLIFFLKIKYNKLFIIKEF